MRIVVWGINYSPELTGIAPYNTALCRHLAQAGHEVTMVTGFPYYPEWRKPDSDRGAWFRSEDDGGVRVQRCWQYVPSRPSPVRRMVHELTFVALSFLRLLSLRRAHVYVVVSPPLLLGAAAWLLTRWKRAPFVFHVQDLQPDGAAGLKLLRGRWLLRALYGLERFAYRKASRVSGISPGMMRSFRAKGVEEERRVLFPNGVEIPAAADLPLRGRFRRRAGYTADEFLAVYSGNLGVKQGLEVLVDVAAQLVGGTHRLVICGAGSRRDDLARQVQLRQLDNLRLFPLQDTQGYGEMLVDADAAVITQQRGAGSFCFPSKLLSVLAYGLPVVVVADAGSELARAVRAGGFGFWVEPEDVSGVADALRRLSRDRSLGLRLGAAGRRYVAQFRMDGVLRRYQRVLEEVGAATSPKPSKRRFNPAASVSWRAGRVGSAVGGGGYPGLEHG